VNKAELGRHAHELREEIGLGYLDVLDPYKLAKQWGIDVYQLSESDCSPVAREHFMLLKSSVLSGMLIPVDAGAVILENDTHDPLRRRSTMGHEMAHVVRWHTFTSGVVDERGCRLSSAEDEAEASHLGAELLVPTKAANWMAFRDYTDEQVSAKFEVSIEIARWRMNASGARRFADNARRKSAK
jgi:hypothetical protein